MNKKEIIKEIKRNAKLMNINEDFISDLLLQALNNLFKGLDPSTKTSKTNLDNKVKQTVKSLIPSSDFEEIAGQVIDKLEGGYYHPDMKNDGRCPTCGRMGDSGETMMGIDRKHGTTINKSAEGIEFWNLIDKAGARNKWKWNYKGGQLEPQLRDLVVKIIKPRYDDYSRRYLTPEASQIVNSNPALMFHFIYAVWNGPGWFRYFAGKVNDEVKKGNTNPDDLAKFAIRTRVNSSNPIISRGGRKIDDLVGTNVA
jgi:hypothetical protein